MASNEEEKDYQMQVLCALAKQLKTARVALATAQLRYDGLAQGILACQEIISGLNT